MTLLFSLKVVLVMLVARRHVVCSHSELNFSSSSLNVKPVISSMLCNIYRRRVGS